MASKQYYTSFSLVVTMTVILTAHANDPRGLGEVEDLCEKADFKNLCRDTLQGVSDPIHATEKSINELIAETERTKAKDKTVTKDPKLSACGRSYDAAITDLKKALESLKKKDMESLMIVLSMVIEDYSSCDDMHVDGTVKSPLGGAHKAMIQMASNSLALASMIQF